MPPAPASDPLPLPSFAHTHLHLLTAESTAEASLNQVLTASGSPRTLHLAGLAVPHLVLTALRTGLGGKTIVEFGADPAIAGGVLPEHGIRVGDVVAVRGYGGAGGGGRKGKGKGKGKMAGKGVEDGESGREIRGVVTRVRREGVSVALDEEGEDIDTGAGVLQGRVWLLKLANEVTYKRMALALNKLAALPSTGGGLTPLQQVLLGHAAPASISTDTADPAHPLHDFRFTDPTLNPSQREAIRFALAAPDLALIHGPPGTGKTHTLVELVLQCLQRGQRVLVAGPSNVSVDNLVERLAPRKVRMVRLGHPARLLPAVVGFSLDVLSRESEAGGLVRDVVREMEALQAKVRKTRSGAERREIWREMRELRKELRERERGCTEGLVGGAQVLIGTLHGVGGKQVLGKRFDVLIVDEASMALEAGVWVPLMLSGGVGKLVLAGDHLQLGPVVKADGKGKDGKKNGSTGKDEKEERDIIKGITLEQTMFDRLLGRYGPGVKRMLTVQYRMHEKIMTFPSQELYEGKLEAAEAVKARLLTDLPYDVAETEDTREPLVFWDTQGGDFPEKAEDDEVGKKAGKGVSMLGESKSNELEALLVKLHVSRLVEAGVKEEDIAVITPYNAQLAVLSQLLKERFPGIELGSVDGFQGREKEAVVVSLVRSNAEHEVGFLAEKRRLNVAMTRPRRHLCVIGDSETVSRGSSFLKRWMAFLEEHADLRYPNLNDLYADVDEQNKAG